MICLNQKVLIKNMHYKYTFFLETYEFGWLKYFFFFAVGVMKQYIF